MSYTSPEELLCPPIEKIRAGIAELREAIKKRSENTGEWTKEHIKELFDLEDELIPLDRKLLILSQEVR